MRKPSASKSRKIIIRKAITGFLVIAFLFTSISVTAAQNTKLAPALRLNSEDFKLSFTVAAICKDIEQDGNLDDTAHIEDVLTRVGPRVNPNITVLPHEIIIESPNEGLAVRYFDPAKANVLTSYSDVEKLQTKVIGPLLCRQIIHRVKASPSSSNTLRTKSGSEEGIKYCVSDFTPNAVGQKLAVTIQANVHKAAGWILPSDKWTIEKHIDAITAQHGSGTVIKGYMGNGNAICNKGHIVFLNQKLNYSAAEPVHDRAYSIFAAYKSGGYKVLDVVISENDRIISAGKDITDKIDWAISGERIVRSGKGVNWRTDDAFKNYQDPRHMFWFPYSIFDNRSEEAVKATGKKDVFREILWNDLERKETARSGNYIELPIARFKDFGYGDSEYLHQELIKAGYAEDEFHFTKNDLVIKLKPGIYQYHTIGITDSGRVKTVAVTSKNREKGITLDQLTEINTANGIMDSIMLDQGGDVLVMEDGKFGAESLDGRRIFTSMIFLLQNTHDIAGLIDEEKTARAEKEKQTLDREEFESILNSYASIKKAADDGTLDRLLPEWIAMKDCPQSGPHRFTVGGHTLQAIKVAEERGYITQGVDCIRFNRILLLHDLGKSWTYKPGDKDIHYQVSAAKARIILQRLGYSQEDIDRDVWYILYHDMGGSGHWYFDDSERNPYIWAMHEPTLEDVKMFKVIALSDNASKSKGGEYLTEVLKEKIDVVTGILAQVAQAGSEEGKWNLMSELKRYFGSLQKPDSNIPNPPYGASYKGNIDNLIDRNSPMFRDFLGEDKPPILLRVPVEAIEVISPDNIKNFLGQFQSTPNGHIELYYMSGVGEVSESVYQKYGLQKKPLPKDFKRTRENTVTLFPALKGEEINQSAIVTRLGSISVTPENTILSPIDLQHDPAGLIRATILGLKIMDIARQIKDGKRIDKDAVHVDILNQLRDVLDPSDFKSFDLTPEDIIALATGNINSILIALKKLIKLLPIMPINAEELRQIYEHVKAVITAA